MFPRWLSLHGRAICLGFGVAILPALPGCDPCCRPGLFQAGPGHRLGSRIPVEPAPPPPGTYLNNFAQAQAQKAEADDFVIYGYEWHQQGVTTGPWGTAHLKRIALRLPHEPFPVVIEECASDPGLNKGRREFVVKFLQNAGIGDADVRVVVAGSDAAGLHGDEIEPIYRGFLQRGNNQFGGVPGGGFGGGVPGFGTPPLVPQVPFGGFGGTGGFGNFGGGR